MYEDEIADIADIFIKFYNVKINIFPYIIQNLYTRFDF
jgi:hypothetical protein